MWREFLERVAAKRPGETCRFCPPAHHDEIARAKRDLGTLFPRDLQSFLQETNGADAVWGDLETAYPLVLPVEQIVDATKTLRQKDPDTFDAGILLIQDVGNGDLVGLDTWAGDNEYMMVYWDHEDNSIREVADSLRTFLARKER